MTSANFQQIIADAPAKIRGLLGELEPRVLAAAADALETAQDAEGGGEPRVAVGLKLVIGLEHTPPAWHVEGRIAVAYKVVSEKEQLDDTPELAEGMGRGRKPRKPRPEPVDEPVEPVFTEGGADE